MVYIYNAKYATQWKIILMDNSKIGFVAGWIDLTCFSRESL